MSPSSTGDIALFQLSSCSFHYWSGLVYRECWFASRCLMWFRPLSYWSMWAELIWHGSVWAYSRHSRAQFDLFLEHYHYNGCMFRSHIRSLLHELLFHLSVLWMDSPFPWEFTHTHFSLALFHSMVLLASYTLADAPVQVCSSLLRYIECTRCLSRIHYRPFDVRPSRERRHLSCKSYTLQLSSRTLYHDFPIYYSLVLRYNHHFYTRKSNSWGFSSYFVEMVLHAHSESIRTDRSIGCCIPSASCRSTSCRMEPCISYMLSDSGRECHSRACKWLTSPILR